MTVVSPAQVEAQVKHKDSPKQKSNPSPSIPEFQISSDSNGMQQIVPDSMSSLDPPAVHPFPLSDSSADPMVSNDPFSISAEAVLSDMDQNILNGTGPSLGFDDSFSWEMIGLGLEEPMPTQEAVDELYVQWRTSLSRQLTIAARKFTSRNSTHRYP